MVSTQTSTKNLLVSRFQDNVYKAYLTVLRKVALEQIMKTISASTTVKIQRKAYNQNHTEKPE